MEVASSGWNDYVHENNQGELCKNTFLQNLKENKITYIQYQFRQHPQKGLLLFITPS